MYLADPVTGQELATGQAPVIAIVGGGAAPRAQLAGGWLVNCTGPAADVTAAAHPLLRQLLDAGLARPDPLRLVLDIGPRGAVRDAHGRPAADIFALGPLLRGSRYETTAIPEIRDQAVALARHLLAGPGLPVLRNREARVPA